MTRHVGYVSLVAAFALAEKVRGGKPESSGDPLAIKAHHSAKTVLAMGFVGASL